jgi:trypsin
MSNGRTRTDSSKNDVISLIVGGTDAGVGAYTHQVALYGSTSSTSFTCGGILVAYDIVITAAHCVDSVNVAKIGLYYLNNPTGSETISICQKVKQPNGDDIGLLKLCQVSALAQQGTVRTIKLNANPSVPSVGQVLTVTGWGDTTEGGNISNTLQKVDVNYVSQDTCVAVYGVNSAEMCAGVTGGGKDSCQGDSGGPLVIGQSAANFVLVGVVSSGNGCARAGFPGVYNRISSEISWVLSQGCAMTSITPCGIQTTNGNPLPTLAPVFKPVVKPIIKPVATPVIKPVATPVIKPVATPVIKPVATPVIKPVATPVIKPLAAPVIKPAPTKPVQQPASQPVSAVVFQLQLTTDKYGSDTGWKLTRKGSPSTVVMEKVAGTYASDTTYTETLNISSKGSYEFVITDTFGDGLTQSVSSGYSVIVGGVLAQAGRDFGSQEKLFLFGY